MGDRTGLARIERAVGASGLADRLALGLPPSDLTTLLLEVVRRRAAATSPATVLDRHLADRLVRPTGVDVRARSALAARLVAGLPEDVELVDLAPVVPLGTHSVVAPVHQDRVVSTVRGTEVAADPTNGLALVAAARRRDDRHEPAARTRVVRLGALQQVLRAQPFTDPDSFQHFELLGLVSAGRDRGTDVFERATATADVGALVDGCRAVGVDRVEVRVTDLTGGRAPLLETLADTLHAHVVPDPDRRSGRGYYRHTCWKLLAGATDGPLVELGDGGFTDWTASLVSDAKERLHVAGLSTARLLHVTR